MRHRHLICRLIRLTYGEDAQYIVEALEPLRVEAAEQAAYALALEAEARGAERSR
jgi:hypothetical protein